jgi:hypothetical protein
VTPFGFYKYPAIRFNHVDDITDFQELSPGIKGMYCSSLSCYLRLNSQHPLQ